MEEVDQKLTGALEIALDLKFCVSLQIDAVVQALVVVALVLAHLVVVSVLTVAVLADVLTGKLLCLQLCLGVGVDEFVHVDDVLCDSVTARAAAGRLGAQRELDKVLCVEDAPFVFTASAAVLATDLDQRRAGLVLDVVVVHEARISLLLVLLEHTGR
jgi:hypothetical protein